jgi:hypothetical protein
MAEQEQELRIAILGALPDLRLPALRNLLWAVRYAEEGADAVAVRLSDLNDAHRRRLLLAIHGGQANGKTQPAATEEAR